METRLFGSEHFAVHKVVNYYIVHILYTNITTYYNVISQCYLNKYICNCMCEYTHTRKKIKITINYQILVGIGGGKRK